MRRLRDALAGLALAGCATSGGIGALSPADQVAHALDGALVADAEVWIPPADGPDGPFGEAPSVAVLGAAASPDGGLDLLVAPALDADPAGLAVIRVDAGGATLLPVESAADPYGYPYLPVSRLVRAGGWVVVWTCSGSVYVGADGDDALHEVPAPPTGNPYASCPTGLTAAGDGVVMGAALAAGEFDVRTWRLDASGLTETDRVLLPASGASEVILAGTGPAGPWVVATTGFALVRIDADGAISQDAPGLVSLAPEGDGFLALTGGSGATGLAAWDLHRWTPADGGWEDRGHAEVSATESAALAAGGALAATREGWGVDEKVTVLTDAWAVAPADGHLAADPALPLCDDPEACARIGAWFPVGAVPVPGGRRAVWILWSWLGPSALVATPL